MHMGVEQIAHRVLTSLRQFRDSGHGQDLLEYAFLASLISVFAVGAVTLLGQLVDQVFWQNVAASL
jgi:Flp pilus assembly pilin Flp